MRPRKLFFLLILTFCLIIPFSPTAHSLGSNTLGRYTVPGPSNTLYVQRINNTSFGAGTSYWKNIAYNNYSSSFRTISPGYNTNNAENLSITSGNLTTYSSLALLQEFSSNPVAFGQNLNVRVAIQVQRVQGNTSSDRVELSLSLASSIGNTVGIHYVFATGASPPTNTTSDAYFNILPSSGWTLLDRNVTADARSGFPNFYRSLTAVKDVRLVVYATSLGNATDDPRIMYQETGTDSYWNITEPVVFDPDADGTYNMATDTVLYSYGGNVPANGTSLRDDLRIKYVDKNLDGKWETGEPIVYDLHNEGVYDFADNDPVIYGTPTPGALLQYPVRRVTTALFDQIELYSPNGDQQWIQNGDFETGSLSSWGNTAGFQTTSSLAHSGKYSVQGTVTNGTRTLAQSIDGEPIIDSSTLLTATAYVSQMTGAANFDRVDVWLGLVDSSPTANPASIYYYFKTGDGTIPMNTTDSENIKANGFGTLNNWLSLNESLIARAGFFTSQGLTPPYRVQVIALEVSAEPSTTTSAYFDTMSLRTHNQSGIASSTYYATDGQNSTYLYQVNQPQQSFTLNLPPYQTLVNITSPGNTKLQTTEYNQKTFSTDTRLTISDTTISRYTPGSWQIYTTSNNAVSSIYAEDASSLRLVNLTRTLTPGYKVDLVELSIDPYGMPIPGANSTISIWSQNGTLLNSWTGQADLNGFYRVHGIALPSSNGAYTMQATSFSTSDIGIRTRQFSIQAPPTVSDLLPWIITIGIIGAIAAVTGFMIFRRRRQKRSASPQSPQQAKTKKNNALRERGVLKRPYSK